MFIIYLGNDVPFTEEEHCDQTLSVRPLLNRGAKINMRGEK